MPSWSAFNSVIIATQVTKQKIGFLSVLPFSITEYSTVKTMMDHFLGILNQLDQSHIPVACDEGVYCIDYDKIILISMKFK